MNDLCDCLEKQFYDTNIINFAELNTFSNPTTVSNRNIERTLVPEIQDVENLGSHKAPKFRLTISRCLFLRIHAKFCSIRSLQTLKLCRVETLNTSKPLFRI